MELNEESSDKSEKPQEKEGKEEFEEQTRTDEGLSQRDQKSSQIKLKQKKI